MPDVFSSQVPFLLKDMNVQDNKVLQNSESLQIQIVIYRDLSPQLVTLENKQTNKQLGNQYLCLATESPRFLLF